MTEYVNVTTHYNEPYKLNSAVEGDKNNKGHFEEITIGKLDDYWQKSVRFVVLAYSADLSTVLVFRQKLESDPQ